MIQRISSVYQYNSLISRPYNVGTSQAIGVEPSLLYDISSIWKLNMAANIFYYAVKGDIDNINFNNTSFNYTARITNTWSFKRKWYLQLVARYDSKTVTPQGEQEGYVVVDASIRRSFKDGQYNLNLQGGNILNTEKDNTVINTQNVQLYESRLPKYPMVVLTFSMKLNNYKKVLSRHAEADDF